MSVRLDEILKAWASDANITQEERDKLHLTEEQSSALNEALRDCIVDVGDENKLWRFFEPSLIADISGPKNQWRPLAEYVKWIKGNDLAGVGDQRAIEMWEPLMKAFKQLKYVPMPKEVVDSALKATVMLLDIMNEDHKHDLAGYFREVGPLAESVIPYLIQLMSSGKHGEFHAETIALIKRSFSEYVFPMLDDPDPVKRRNGVMIAGKMECEDMAPVYDSIEQMAVKDPDEEAKDLADHASSLVYLCKNLSQEVAVASTPVSCFKGELPDNIPHIDPPACLNQAPDPDFWKRLGILEAKHPLFRITLHLPNRSQIDDFRSASLFEAIADSGEIAKTVQQKRSIVILYPASGSHMASLAVPFKLIDAGKIDSAKLIYTETDKKAVERIKAYLNWYEKQGMIDNLALETVDFKEGTEFKFNFDYKDKKIVLVYALERGGGIYWARKEYMKESDMVVFHDGIYEEKDHQATKFVEKLRSFHDKTRFVLSNTNIDMVWPKPKRAWHRRLGLPYVFFRGPYGCSGNHYATSTAYRIIGNKIVKDDRPRENQQVPIPLRAYSHRDLPDGAVLIKVK